MGQVPSFAAWCRHAPTMPAPLCAALELALLLRGTLVTAKQTRRQCPQPSSLLSQSFGDFRATNELVIKAARKKYVTSRIAVGMRPRQHIKFTRILCSSKTKLHQTDALTVRERRRRRPQGSAGPHPRSCAVSSPIVYRCHQHRCGWLRSCG